MNYQIAWLSQAFDQMQRLVGRFADRQHEFAAILRDITATLTADPTEVGESRGGRMRVHFFGRLTVKFIPFTDRGVVYVVGVHMPPDRL